MSYSEIQIKMERIANSKEEEDRKNAEEENDKPCAVCGSKEFVQKFRNVVGEISGSMQGHFSLFGGSISSSIDGYTKTLPVLSCRKCENEREIAVWNFVYRKDVFWDFMYEFYHKIDRNSESYEVDQFFLERPLETREYALNNKNYDYDFYNKITEWSTETWAKAGFKIPKIKKRYFIFWEREVYPTWEELSKLTTNQ